MEAIGMGFCRRTLASLAVMLVFIVMSVFAEEGFRHHVVGDDRGWDPTSDVASWVAGRNFVVGDTLWFMYSAAHEKVAEVASKEEYEACDLRSPIRMYTDGLSKISLDTEGTRFFVSGHRQSCTKGLKIPVHALNSQLASPPSSPSGSGRLSLYTYIRIGPLIATLASLLLFS